MAPQITSNNRFRMMEKPCCTGANQT